MSDKEELNTVTLDHLVEAVNSTAATARNIANAMLAVGLAIGATIIGSTNEAIFRDELSSFFGLSVPIRLSTAYTLMPPVFLFLHVNVLLQFHVLRERLIAFNTLLHREVRLAASRDLWRRRLHGFMYVQLFIDDEKLGGRKGRALEYIRNALLWIVIRITIWLPLFILIAAQISFLRYQSDAITMTHRLAVLVDLGFIFWFGLDEILKALPHKSLLRMVARWSFWVLGSLAFSPTIIFLTWCQIINLPETVNQDEIKKYQKRLFSEYLKPTPFIASQWQDDLSKRIADNLLDSTLCPLLHEFGCRYIDLQNATVLRESADPSLIDKLDLDDKEEIAESRRIFYGFSAQNRHFRFADLRNSRLFAADFIDSDFTGAWMDSVRLQFAKLNNAQFQSASLNGTQFQGAELDGAQLENASLWYVQLQGASLEGAKLRSAILIGAWLQGASLRDAQLQGALLDQAQLQGAKLGNAQLQGASLDRAQLQGASLVYAQLQGTSLNYAQLQGAHFDGTGLQGASLGNAKLQGSFFSFTNLDYAIFHSVDLRSASSTMVACGKAWFNILDKAVWLADDRKKFWFDLRSHLVKYNTDDEIMERIKSYIIAPEIGTATISLPCNESAPADAPDFVKGYAKIITDLACSDPAIGKGIVRNLALSLINDANYRMLIRDAASKLHDEMQKPEPCLGLAEIDNRLKSKIEAFVKDNPPSP